MSNNNDEKIEVNVTGKYTNSKTRAIVDASKDELVQRAKQKRGRSRKQKITLEGEIEVDLSGKKKSLTNEQIKGLFQKREWGEKAVSDNTKKLDINNLIRIQESTRHKNIVRTVLGYELTKEGLNDVMDKLHSRADKWNDSSRASFIRTLYILFTILKEYDIITDEKLRDMNEVKKYFTLQSNLSNREKTANKIYPRWEDYFDNIKERYEQRDTSNQTKNKRSLKEYLLVNLYKESPGVRDGFSYAILFDSMQDRDDINYFVLKDNEKLKFRLNDFKTKARFERATFEYTQATTDLFREYVRTHNKTVEYGKPAFLNLSKFFSDLHKSLYPDLTMAGTNAFRHMIINHMLSNKLHINDAVIRQKIADEMMHTPLVTLGYLTRVAKKTSDLEAEAIADPDN
jgi:hypothetical protein